MSVAPTFLTSPFKRLHNFKILPVVLFIVSVTTGCSSFLNSYYSETVPPDEGVEAVRGLKRIVMVRRDRLGIPLIDAENTDDLVFAMGYVNAMDRLPQMVGMKLLAQGRLSEMAGPAALEMDMYMRSFSLMETARGYYEASSDETKQMLNNYAAGVNAYIEKCGESLPPLLDLAKYSPRKWEPEDSVSISVMTALGLAFNFFQEVDILNIIQKTGVTKAAWLIPVYPDEPIPFTEVNKLAEINLAGTAKILIHMAQTGRKISEISLFPTAASNNWVISKEHTANNASILACDTHLPISMPCAWQMMHLRCPEYEIAGVGLAGVPGIMAGYNGKIAWGMTMVMADNQDIFLEKLKQIDGKLHYLYKEDWIAATERKEIFHIKGKEAVEKTLYATHHGPLLNDPLKIMPSHGMMPSKIDIPFGISLGWTAFEADNSFDAYLAMTMADSAEEAIKQARQIKSTSLNMVIADRENIAWQVTGRYPIRKKGSGLVPSPGWSGEYDWDGYLDTDKLPCSVNPEKGFIGTANNRTVPADFPYRLSSSWYYPDRAERITQMILESEDHNFKSSMKMQLDTVSVFIPKLKAAILDGGLFQQIESAIRGWTDQARQDKAHEAISILQGFDGDMKADSAQAAVAGVFLSTSSKNIFLDELGPEDGTAWKSFCHMSSLSYSAQADHLTVRGDESPFWDNTDTPEKETKADIIAESFADTIEFLENTLGKERDKWQWGAIHTYFWETESSKIARNMSFDKKNAMKNISGYLNRGPYPAPGDHTTLNVAAYSVGRDFDAWLIPAMRMVVDFSLVEPMYLVNSTGQSDNPSSPHYDDGIEKWRKGEYRVFHFKEENILKTYRNILVLKPEF